MQKDPWVGGTATKTPNKSNRPRHPLEPKDGWDNGPQIEEQVDGAVRAAGIRDIVSGAVLIGIGFAMGGSVFTGADPTILDWMFDLLGAFWIIKGIVTLVRS